MLASSCQPFFSQDTLSHDPHKARQQLDVSQVCGKMKFIEVDLELRHGNKDYGDSQNQGDFYFRLSDAVSRLKRYH